MKREFAAPLCAVDTVGEAGADRIEGVKEIVTADPYLIGHYPDFTIYPGVFTVESVHQLVRRWAVTRHGDRTRAELVSIDSVAFLAPLLPGDTLRMSCQVTEESETSTVRVKARCTRSDGALTGRMKLGLRIHREDVDA